MHPPAVEKRCEWWPFVGHHRTALLCESPSAHADRSEATTTATPQVARTFGASEATEIGTSIGVDFARVDLEQFRRGLSVEFEHGTRDPDTNVTGDDLATTGRIAWAHLKEIPDYYARLAKMESEANS